MYYLLCIFEYFIIFISKVNLNSLPLNLTLSDRIDRNSVNHEVETLLTLECMFDLIPAPLSILDDNQDKVMFRSLEVRLYPTVKQETQINKTLGCSRFIYNQMLAERKSFYEANKTNKEVLKTHKYKTEKQYKEEFQFLKEPDATALQQSRVNLETGFKNAFASLSGKRKGPKMGFPVFKKKGGREAYKTVDGFKFFPKVQKLQLMKLGKVSFSHKGIQQWYLESELKSITVKKNPSGKYFAVLLFKGKDDSKPRNLNKELKVIGLDMSLSSLFIDSNSEKPEGFEKQFQKNHKRLARAQRRVSRKPIGTKNRLKASRKAACVHEDITNKRKDYSRKLAKKIVMENDVVGIETLNLNGMKQFNHGKSITDISWTGFVSDLENNAKKHGKLIHKVSRWYPSSKTCSCCGVIKEDLMIQDRSWSCVCGVTHDRDFNAAKNIRQETIKNIGSAGPESTSMEMDSNGRLIRNNKLLRTVNEVEIKPLKESLTT